MTTKNMVALAAAALLTVTIITAVVWALASRERPAPALYAWLGDSSDSTTINCDAVESMVEEILANKRTTHGSYLYLFSTGDDNSADEPILRGKYKVPVSARVLEGQARNEKAKREFIGQVKGRCEAEPVKKRSPIVLGLKRVIENLRTSGCDAKAGCRVYVHTDGHELAEPTVKQSVSGRSTERSSSTPMIANEGITVKICGFAQVKHSRDRSARHSVRSSEEMDAAWKKLFVEPESVIIQPHCQ